ncbi:unnamed protein product, partial [Ascophyllum nodosum]
IAGHGYDPLDRLCRNRPDGHDDRRLWRWGGSGWRCRCGGSVEFLATGYDDFRRFQHAGEACRRLSTGLRDISRRKEET